MEPQNKNENIQGKYFKSFVKQDYKIIPKTRITIFARRFHSCGYRTLCKKYGECVIICAVVIRSLTENWRQRGTSHYCTEVG